MPPFKKAPERKTQELELSAVVDYRSGRLMLGVISMLLNNGTDSVKLVDDTFILKQRTQKKIPGTSKSNFCKYEKTPARIFSANFTREANSTTKINASIHIFPETERRPFHKMLNCFVPSTSIKASSVKLPPKGINTPPPYHISSLSSFNPNAKNHQAIYSFEKNRYSAARIDIRNYKTTNELPASKLLSWKLFDIKTTYYWHHLEDSNYMALFFLQPEKLIIKDQINLDYYFFGDKDRLPGAFFRGICFFLKILEQTKKIEEVSYKLTLTNTLKDKLFDGLNENSKNKNTALIEAETIAKKTFLTFVKNRADIAGLKISSEEISEASTSTASTTKPMAP